MELDLKESKIDSLPCPDTVLGLLVQEKHLTITPDLSESDVIDMAELVLKQLAASGNELAPFRLGQLFFEHKLYDSAFVEFFKIAETDPQAAYQLGVLYYDGIGIKQNQEAGVKWMKHVATSADDRAKHLISPACYAVGLAYFQGFGVKQSYTDAEKWFLKAADDGNPLGSIKAQSTLGFLYCQPELLNYEKAFFWHTEATGNGSLESQAALGWFHYLGRGRPHSDENAIECWKGAAERGSVHAMGSLTMLFYNRKLFNKATQLAQQVTKMQDLEKIAEQTDCQLSLIRQGVARAAFIYARCLHLGLSIKQDIEVAKEYYSMAVWYSPKIAAQMQKQVQQGLL